MESCLNTPIFESINVVSFRGKNTFIKLGMSSFFILRVIPKNNVNKRNLNTKRFLLF